jgi:hypothetical protein
MPKSCLTFATFIMAAAAWAAAQAPAAPTLAFPADMAKYITTSTSLKWRKTASATIYHVQLAADPGFAVPLFEDSALADTLASVKRLADSTLYYWRARAGNASGFGAYSKTRSFTTNPPLGTGPALVSPAEYSLGQPLSPTLVWNAFPGAKAYGVQISLMNNFSVILFQDTSVKDTTLKIAGPLEKGTLYYWHVRANTSPAKTAWTKGNFTTLTDPPTAAAALSLPAEGALDQPLTLELSWEGVERASNYVYQVSTKADFSAPEKSDSTAITSALVEGLAANTAYFWRVKGTSVSGQAPFSAARGFRTGNGSTGLREARRAYDARNGGHNPMAGAVGLRIIAGSPRSGGFTAEIDLRERTPVVVTAYGALGREKHVLARGTLEAGTYRFGLPERGAAGLWWIEVRADGNSQVARVIR